jgi:NAD(P)-dependent dehydrogenase (short-subunit alcohol dehydrogenase family)
MESNAIRAVVSGGASGLGHAVAQKIIGLGGRATLVDVNAAAGEKAAAKLGDRAWFRSLDVTDEAAADKAMQGAAEDMGGLNVAVSCAGILGPGRVLGREAPMALDYFARTIKVNLIGTFNIARAASNIMQRNEPGEDGERGVIVNTASVAAWEGQIGQCAYSASKAGVVGMTLPIAREFARIGVRVNTIAPGVFHTPMVDGMPAEVQDALGASVPFPSRLGKPAEFADLVLHVINNRYLNGATLRLDGAIRLQAK